MSLSKADKMLYDLGYVYLYEKCNTLTFLNANITSSEVYIIFYNDSREFIKSNYNDWVINGLPITANELLAIYEKSKELWWLDE